MQIIRLHKNVYKLYAWARTQECLDAYRIKYEATVRHWDALRAEGVSLGRRPINGNVIQGMKRGGFHVWNILVNGRTIQQYQAFTAK